MTRTMGIGMSIAVGVGGTPALNWGPLGPLKHPRFMLYGGLSTACAPVAPSRGAPLDSALLDTYARFPVACLPLSPAGDDRTDLIEQLRIRNPSQVRLAYLTAQNSHSTWASPDQAGMIMAESHAAAVAAGAWHSDWGLVNVDITAPAGGGLTVGEKLAPIWCQALEWWDGLFLDIFCQFPPNEINETNFPGQSAAKIAAWPVVCQSMATIIRNRLGPKVLVGNCAVASTLYDRLNGWMREHFPNQNGGTWNSNMVDGSPTYPGGYITDAGLYVRTPYMGAIFSAAVPNGGPYTQASAANQKLMRFGLGSACLSDGVFVFAPSDIPIGTLYYDWFYDEWGVNSSGVSSTNPAHTLWLGEPIGPAFEASGLWLREFEHGIVLVNPTGSAIDIELESAFPGTSLKHLSGTVNPSLNNGSQPAADYTVPSADARFLFKG